MKPAVFNTIPAAITLILLVTSLAGATNVPGGYGKVAAIICPTESSTSTPADRGGNLETWREHWNTVVNEVLNMAAWWNARAYTHSPRAYLTLDVWWFTPAQCTINWEPIALHHTNDTNWWHALMSRLGYALALGGASAEVHHMNSRVASFSGNTYGYAIFVADSRNDTDGRFTDGFSAYVPGGSLRGPISQLTYDNGGWGIDSFDMVCAHETGHIFGALDEYSGACSCAETSFGYTNNNCVHCASFPGGAQMTCIMHNGTYAFSPYDGPTNNICYWTRGQIGWNPTAVNIVQVEVYNKGSGIGLEWNNPPKRSIIGFNLYRRDIATGERQLLTPAPLPSNRRSFSDDTAGADKTYIYEIEEINVDGVKFIHESKRMTRKVIFEERNEFRRNGQDQPSTVTEKEKGS